MKSLQLHTIIKTSIWHSLKKLSNLTFAINILLCIACFSIIGTIVEQNQNLQFYKDTYSNKLLWIVDWQFIKNLQLDHVYTTWWFVTLIIIFSGSLIVCTLAKQLPMLRYARKWKFYSRQQQILRLQNTTSVKSSPLPAFTFILNHNNYHVFQQMDKIYAYKGLIGRIAPIFVHLSIILLLFGSLLGFFGGLLVQEMITVGETIHPQNITESGRFSYLQQRFVLRVDNFAIKYNYNLDKSIQQFISDLSILDFNGHQQAHGIVQVNTPLYFQNITIYQTDWDIVAIRLRLQNNQYVQIPCQLLKQAGNKTWISTIRLSSNNTISIIISDLTGELYVYNQQGYLTNVTKTHEILKFRGTNIYIEDILARTGLQIKTDPGIWVIYLSFTILIISGILSYTSYSQLWAIYSHKELYLGGKTNRAYLDFEDDLTKIKQHNLTTYRKSL